ncbi:2Fe-2S iron-sulfur cluster-binding protein [Bradyrhizobium pachyrhizi]|uniref:2Fe-2S iron-sulfur cluster-binding protein n=1 Tax=Bradyrhizobium pachyrhizi TaxID=280333 RepID=UPI003D31B10A
MRCRRGECGVCAIDIIKIDGELNHRDVFFSEPQKRANEKICACVSRAPGHYHGRYAAPPGRSVGRCKPFSAASPASGTTSCMSQGFALVYHGAHMIPG